MEIYTSGNASAYPARMRGELEIERPGFAVYVTVGYEDEPGIVEVLAVDVTAGDARAAIASLEDIREEAEMHDWSCDEWDDAGRADEAACYADSRHAWEAR